MCLAYAALTISTGIFPGQGRSIWRDWYTHEVVNASVSANTTLSAPLGHIPVHIRDGAALLLHAAPAYTIAETREGPYALLVAQAADGYAFGTAYLDDGETVPPTPNTTLTISARKGALTISPHGNFHVQQKLETVTILGAATARPMKLTVNGEVAEQFDFDAGLERIVISGANIDLNVHTTIVWE